MDNEGQPGPLCKQARPDGLDTFDLKAAVLKAMRALETDPSVESEVPRNDGLQDLVALVQAHGVAATRVTTPESPSEFGMPKDSTPLHLLCSRGFGEYAELLVERGADVRAKDSEWRLPLHVAVDAGSVRCVRAVLGGVAKRASNLTPYGLLQAPAYSGDEDVVRVLMEAGAGVGECKWDGGHALWFAITQGYFGIVRALVEGGVDPATKVSDMRVVDGAWLFGRHDIASWLTKRLGPGNRSVYERSPPFLADSHS